jgi:hypothetical protein
MLAAGVRLLLETPIGRRTKKANHGKEREKGVRLWRGNVRQARAAAGLWLRRRLPMRAGLRLQHGHQAQIMISVGR